jgi:hypothetical protein
VWGGGPQWSCGDSWTNQKACKELDALTAGSLPLYLLFSKKDPFGFVFSDDVLAAWSGDRAIPGGYKPMIRAVAASWQLFVFLRLLEAGFGREITRILREHLLIAADRAPEFQLSTLLQAIEDIAERESQVQELKTFPARVALAALTTMPASPYFLPPDKRSPGATRAVHAAGGCCRSHGRPAVQPDPGRRARVSSRRSSYKRPSR